MTKQPLNDVLNECLTLLERDQVTLEECLARYPQQAADLRPLLEIAHEISRVARPTPSPAAFAAGKQRMLQALAEKKRRQPSPLSRRRAWIAALFGEREGKPTARRRAPAFQVALAAALALLLVSGGLFLRSWLGTTVAWTATLEAMSGGVEVRPAGSETWLPASPAQRLELGDRIRTGPLSTARLVFFDDSTTDLEAETEITIAQMMSRRDGHGKVITLYQRLGRSHNYVQRLPDSASRFEIETPATVAVVRGTEFSIAVEANGATQVAVWKGFVEVTAREKTVQVQPGEMTSVRPNLPPSLSVRVPTRWPPEVFLPTPKPSEPALSGAEGTPVSTLQAKSISGPSAQDEAGRPQPTGTPMPEPTQTPKAPQKPEPAVPTATPVPPPTPVPPTLTPVPPTPTPVPPTPTGTPAPPPTSVPQPTEILPPTPTETPAPPPTPPPPPTESIEALGLPETPTPTED